MNAKFHKVSSRKSQQARKKTRVAPKKPAGTVDKKTPVSRVGDGKDHHDTISTTALYVLVDDPKEPPDSVDLNHGSQVWEMNTNEAQPLYNSTLVFALPFENVPEQGKLTLKLQRGGSSPPAELFTKIEFKQLFLYDVDLIVDKVPFSKRVLDYDTVAPRPFYNDPDLDQKAPHTSLGGGE